MPRLLWRGSLHSQSQSTQLHGLAIVASSFSLVPRHQQQQYDPDDPFSSSPQKHGSNNDNAELCLDLEMLRNRTLRVIKQVKILSSEQQDASEKVNKIHGRRALKQSIDMLRKGKQKEDATIEHDAVYLDGGNTTTEDIDNLSLYIDQRASDTIEYFNNLFCTHPVNQETGKTKIGLLVSLGGEGDEDGGDGMLQVPSSKSSLNFKSSVVIYGRVKTQSEGSSRPILQLHVARQRNKNKELGPRPDDPAPRENLFAQKLRRTVSQPLLSLSTSAPVSSSSSSTTLPPLPLPHNRVTKRPTLSSIRTAPSAAAAAVGKPISSSASSHAQNASRILHRSKSSSVAAAASNQASSVTVAGTSKARNPFALSAKSSSSSSSKDSDTSKKRSQSSSSIHASPGRRGSKRPRLTAGGLRALEEEEAEDDLAQPGNDLDMMDNTFDIQEDSRDQHNPEEDEEDWDPAHLVATNNRRDRDHSPTPSMASAKSYNTSFTLATTLAVGARAQAILPVAGKGKTAISRSMSMPPGQLLGVSKTAAPSMGRKEREASIAGTEAGGPASVETRNKGTIRKILLSEMILRNYTREHPDFTEVFSVAYKGIQCAFRRSIVKDKLDKEALQEIVRRHLEMYIPPR